METLIVTLEETPLWILLVLVFLLFSGIRASQRRTMTLPRLFLLPALLVIWSLYNLHEQWQGEWTIVCYWIISLVGGSLIGWWIIRKWKIHVDRERKTLILPGSWSTLWLILTIFAIRYFFVYYDATHPIVPHSIFLADAIISAAITGVFVGRAMNYLYRYEKVL